MFLIKMFLFRNTTVQYLLIYNIYNIQYNIYYYWYTYFEFDFRLYEPGLGIVQKS